MELNQFKGVIRRVYEKTAGQTFEAFFERLTDAIEIAEEMASPAPVSSALAGRTETAKPMLVPPIRKSAEIVRAPADKSELIEAITSQFKGAILIGAAPPVAGADESDEPGEEIDYWETKPGAGNGCNPLEKYLKEILPSSITVELPNFSAPLVLNRGVSGPGKTFVYVTYSIPGSQELGPRVPMMTSMKKEKIDPDAIIQDILAQAGAIYSPEKRTIVPRSTPSPGMPSPQDLQRILERDRKGQQPNDGLSGDEARLASEDAISWSKSRSPQWQ